jgi:hypothetical protein
MVLRNIEDWKKHRVFVDLVHGGGIRHKHLYVVAQRLHEEK